MFEMFMPAGVDVNAAIAIMTIWKRANAIDK